MPELPEVETTRRGIEPHIAGKRISKMLVRERRLRWPIPKALEAQLAGQKVDSVERRGKYLLLRINTGSLIVHLGMSGSLRVLEPGIEQPLKKHDHVELVFDDDTVLRYHDPRRFGCILWQEDPVSGHPLIESLGPEPLSADFNARLLFARSRGRKAPIKTFIMDSKVVVGVGNIYANEALFFAGINPQRAAGKVSLARYEKLVECIKRVLARAIEVGGTTLRDFTGSDGKPGYFAQSLQVYGRAEQPCNLCEAPLKEIRLGQRSTVYCTRCQR
ncbi:MAG: bifunctional DNA-formamidopyrimidine glycosylase/DNA-(apurinic or apyrimidinic site) lyase [Pseudomonadales bacterium]|nr:bifunctional DNA-formamidopyrimidine glycosylase/DNA-(apurinic or apyrimidinic site) lyase [Pseudomonadales bacterium]